MIRFNCPNCQRNYELPNAFAHLPLVCKQCGQHITPPAPAPEPPPPPVAAAPKPPAPSAKPPAPKSPPPPDDDDDGVLVTRPDSTPDIDFNVGGPTAASLSEANRTRPTGLSETNHQRPAEPDAVTEEELESLADINLDLLPRPAPPPAPKPPPPPPEPEPPEDKPEATLVPFLADLGAFVLLVVVGMFVGELLARKPTGQVLSESGASAKFPPMDLILWAAPPLIFGLVYLLLGSRERSLGAWLRRRKTGS